MHFINREVIIDTNHLKQMMAIGALTRSFFPLDWKHSTIKIGRLNTILAQPWIVFKFYQIKCLVIIKCISNSVKCYVFVLRYLSSSCP